MVSQCSKKGKIVQLQMVWIVSQLLPTSKTKNHIKRHKDKKKSKNILIFHIAKLHFFWILEHCELLNRALKSAKKCNFWDIFAVCHKSFSHFAKLHLFRILEHCEQFDEIVQWPLSAFANVLFGIFQILEYYMLSAHCARAVTAYIWTIAFLAYLLQN